MKIGILVSHPTQVEAPFFRYASEDKAHSLEIIYWDQRRARANHDPELKRVINWGIDLWGGYSSLVMPATRRASHLWHEIRAHRFDLLVVNGYNHWTLLLAVVIAHFAGSATALRLDSVTAGASTGIKRRVKKQVLPALFGRYNAFLAASTLTKQYLIDHNVPPASIHYFTYAIDQAWFRARSSLTGAEYAAVKHRFGLCKSKRLILAISKLNAREAPWDLLHAVNSLTANDIEVLIVGDGEDRERVAERARSSNIHVVCPGYVPYLNLPLLYGIANVFVHAPRREPYGVSVAEALACGIPVIASSTVGSGSDLIVHGQNGFVYKLGDSQQLTGYLTRALDALDRSQCQQVSNAVLRRWDYEATWRSILECARQVCPGESIGRS
ncbi:MAG TPA: glycosyltransferase family 4 protein [Vicinamibacterales bacterium]|nr:glycosyltransferase family 4 protein [Vicinamibacterales bacterium]